MNKAGERSYSVGDKLPESTGDKLPAGEMDSTFLGKLFRLDWTLLGKFFRYTGEVAPLNVRYTAGEQSYIQIVGDAC